MTRVIAVAIVITSLAGAAPAAFGLSPGTGGQPSQSCEDQPTGPAGIKSTTNGFATRAEDLYAGSKDSHSLVSGNEFAVSQYDVACFEVSSRPGH
jgi:hypothetical protein